MSSGPFGAKGSFDLGDFVVCNFPYQETPDDPGPETHIGLCLGTMEAAGGKMAVVAAYTTTQVWSSQQPKPRGVYNIGLSEAIRLGQNKPFSIDLRRIAFMPHTETFFPRLKDADLGCVGSDPKLAKRLYADLEKLLQTPGVVVQLGPLRLNR
jgi:hypothetical protein